MSETSLPSRFGKYRGIVLAVAFFLVFDLGVLLLNFYTSYQISSDATAVNLAGRQRMLTQRMAKALFTLEKLSAEGVVHSPAVAELDQAARLFDRTLRAFADGGQTVDGKGKELLLPRVEDDKGRVALNKTLQLWQTGRGEVLKVAGSAELNYRDVMAAQQFIQEQNLVLLGLMNDLTVSLEQVAAAKAEQLRWVQTVGIALALLNFVFILFKFILQLNASDAKAAVAERERAEILSTVREGLLLIDPDYRIGSQYAACLPGLLGTSIQPGRHFLELLQPLLAADVHQAARDYIELLLAGKVKESLVRELNPLADVAIHAAGGARHLSFAFNRALVDGKLSHLLVTVADISRQVELQAELTEAYKQADSSLLTLGKLLRQSPRDLARFCREAEASLLDINNRLRAVDGSKRGYRHLVDALFRTIHLLKGEAATLGVDFVARQAHSFEALLLPLRDGGEVNGEQLIEVSVALQAMFEQVATLKILLRQLGDLGNQVEVDPAGFARSVAQMLGDVAGSQRKAVEADVQLDALAGLPADQAKAVRDMAVQLAKNAVVHGIEAPAERLRQGKPEAGRVAVALAQDEAGQYQLRVHDDGRGLSAAAVREQLLASGRYVAAQLAELSDKQILLKIFEPGFSTAGGVDLHAGRGVGLDAVADCVRQLGGQISLLSRPLHYTEFVVRFPR